MNVKKEKLLGFKEMTPGLQTLLHYERSWFRKDFIAGITVLFYLVPQVLAYSGLVGLPPVAGLATSLVALIVYAILGSSKIISVGPESTVALMSGLIIVPLAANENQVLPLMATLTMVVGGWLLVAWAFRFGVVSALLSKPILVGYLTGSAVLMAVSQLGKATKTSSSGDTVMAQFVDFTKHISEVHWPSMAVAAGTLIVLFALPKITNRLPVALTAIALVTFVTYFAGLASYGIDTLGDLPKGLPEFQMPDLTLDTIQTLLFGGLGVAIVVYSDVMLTARAFNSGNNKISPNKELFALSGVHFATAVTGGYPSSASSSRTAIGKSAGAKTQLYGLIVAAGVALVLLFAGPLFYYLPKAALAAVVVWAATRMIAFDDYKHMWMFRKTEYILAGITALATCTLGILPGIGVAVGLSILELLLRLARPHEAIQGFIPGMDGMHDIDDYSDSVTIPGLLVYRYDAPLFFGNVDDFRDNLETAMEQNEPLNWIILNVEANMHIDFTATSILRKIINTAHKNNQKVGFARLKLDLRNQLEKAGLIDLIGEEMVFSTLPAAVRAYGKAFPDIDTPHLPKSGKPFGLDKKK